MSASCRSWDDETYLYPHSPKLSEIELDDRDILVLGHTHHPLIYLAARGLIVNPGSVGQPRDRNPSAAYAILNSVSHEVSFRRSEYDVGSLQERLIGQGWSGATIDILSRRKTGQ
ncbi:MAG: metallophosphoesterase family protein [Beijerinckiaceae bacterium]